MHGVVWDIKTLALQMEDEFYLQELLILDYMVNSDELGQGQDHSRNKQFQQEF